MFNLVSDYLVIKRLQRKQQQLEHAYLDADLKLAQIEKELIEQEEPEVRPHLAREFAVQRAFSQLGFRTKSTEQCIEMARLWARRGGVR